MVVTGDYRRNRGFRNLKILISNDDGIDAPGLRLLADTARKHGEVWIVAPDGQRSAMSHCFTFNKPVLVKDYDFQMEGVKAYTCSGTPADCVRIGIIKLLPEKPDFVFAGINSGFNMSWDIQYSGTLGAAMEGVFYGVQSIAFSQGNPDNSEVVKRYIDELMVECMSKPLGAGKVWNINFPDCKLEECKGVLRDRAVSTDDFYHDDYDIETIEDGVRSFMISVHRKWEATEGTDLAAIIDNYVSVGIVSNIG